MSKLRVTVWNEYIHELESAEVAAVYPHGIHNCIRDFLREAGHQVGTATLVQPEHGLSQEVLQSTDVLVWWGHKAHDKVEDEIVHRVWRRVVAGMGLIVLHSGHASKIFRKVCGTPTGFLRWREVGESEVLWNIEPAHPITQGIGEKILIPHEEMYGERFNIPAPDELIFLGWFEGGEVFRSGCTFYRGRGRIFYFQPGHETYPVYYQKEIQQVIKNAVLWAAPQGNIDTGTEEGNFTPSVPIKAIQRTGFQARRSADDRA